MNAMLEPAIFVGLGLVAVWAYVRYPGLRPRSLVVAAAHVAISFVGFLLLPAVLVLVLPLIASDSARLILALGLLIPALTYLLLSWVWLIGRIVEMLGGTPRGGHPATSKT
jgi:hypothetical protein